MNKASDLSKASSDARADRLKKWIDTHYENQQAFINKYELNQGEISNIIKKKRVIGERKARKLEQDTDIPTMYLEGLNSLDQIQSLPHQSQIQGGQSQSQSLDMPQQKDIRDLPVRHDGLPASRETPVISWVSAGDYTEVLSGDLSRVIEWIPYNPKAGKYGFALIVDGVSMEPKFMPDDRIYVNPTFQIDELHTGDLVIMACDGDEKATFKELVVEDGNYYLRPLNPNWLPKLMPVNEHCRLVGKVVGRFNNFD